MVHLAHFNAMQAHFHMRRQHLKSITITIELFVVVALFISSLLDIIRSTLNLTEIYMLFTAIVVVPCYSLSN